MLCVHGVDSSQHKWSPTPPQGPHYPPHVLSPICRASRPFPAPDSALEPLQKHSHPSLSRGAGGRQSVPCPGAHTCQLAASSHPADVKAEFFLLSCSKSTKLSLCLLPHLPAFCNLGRTQLPGDFRSIWLRQV